MRRKRRRVSELVQERWLSLLVPLRPLTGGHLAVRESGGVDWGRTGDARLGAGSVRPATGERAGEGERDRAAGLRKRDPERVRVRVRVKPKAMVAQLIGVSWGANEVECGRRQKGEAGECMPSAFAHR